MRTLYLLTRNTPQNRTLTAQISAIEGCKQLVICLLIALLCCCSFINTGFCQNSGDFRSLNSGNWATASNWETYNGSAWTTASTYPGQNAGSYAVAILAGDTISIPNTGISTSAMGNVTISGTLILNGKTSSNVNFGINTPQIYITPNLTPVASIVMVYKSTIILPANAIIRVWANGIKGDCSNNQEVYIGIHKFSACNGAPGYIFTFAELMAGGGSINAIVSPVDTSVCIGSNLPLYGSYTGAVANAPTYKWSCSGPQTVVFSPDSTSQNVTINPTTAGIYTISMTATTDNEGVLYSNQEVRTITFAKKSSAPTAAVSGSDTIMLTQNTTLTLEGGGGGTNETIKWTTSNCGGTLVGMGNNLTVSPTTTTTYYGHYENDYPCSYSTPCVQTTITVIPYANIWKGAISSNFGTAGNWLENTVPDSGENITFDDCPSHDCLLDSNRTVGHIINRSAKNLDISTQTLTITGAISTSGEGKIVATNNAGAITFAGTETQILPATSFAENTIANLVIDGSGVTLMDSLTISLNIMLTSGLFSIGTGTLTLNDSLEISAGSLEGGIASNLIIAGSGANFALPSITLNNLTLNRANGLTLTGSLDVKGALTLTNGSLSLGPNTLTFSGTAPSMTTGVLDAKHSESQIIFANTTKMTLPANLFSGAVSTLTMNGGGGIQLSENLTISKNLQLINGKIQTDGYMVVMENTSNEPIGASVNSYVFGSCRKIGNTAFTFAIGDVDHYAPIGISASTSKGGADDSFTAAYFGENPHPTYDSTMHDSVIERISSMEYWTMDRVGTSSVSVLLSWNGRSGGITKLSDLLVLRWDSAQWVNLGNIELTGNLHSGFVTSNITNNFSTFTLGSLNAKTNTLPICLTEFTANCIDERTNIAWTTVSELNNSHFEIEQSTDASDWSPISHVPGAGNSTIEQKYLFVTENKSNNDLFYRLKSVDYDGTSEYSNILFVKNCRNSDADFKLYPNPSKGVVRFKFSGDTEKIVKNEIYNLIGELVYSSEGFASEVDFSNQPEGTYYAIVHYGSNLIVEKFTIIK